MSHKRSYQSTSSYIRVFSVLHTRCHTKGPTNPQVHKSDFLVYCVPGVTQKVLPIYRFLYMGFYCIVYQVLHKRSYQSTGSYIWVFIILSTRCHTKGPTNLQVLIYGFLVYCLPGVTQKVLPIYRFLYTVFSVLPTRCHTKGPTNLQVLIYGFLVYCLPGVTQKVLPICRFLYTVFNVLAIWCHTKGPTNLQVLIYEFLLYFLPGVTQKVLPFYRFLYKGFKCIVYQVSHKRSYLSTGSYIPVFSVLPTMCHTKGNTNLEVNI